MNRRESFWDDNFDTIESIGDKTEGNIFGVAIDDTKKWLLEKFWRFTKIRVWKDDTAISGIELTAEYIGSSDENWKPERRMIGTNF